MVSGAIVVWSSKKQSCVTFSSRKYKFTVMSQASKDILWFRRFMRNIPFIDVPKGHMTLYCDNQAIIHNTKKDKMSNNSKHIAIRYNHVRNVVKIR